MIQPLTPLIPMEQTPSVQSELPAESWQADPYFPWDGVCPYEHFRIRLQALGVPAVGPAASMCQVNEAYFDLQRERDAGDRPAWDELRKPGLRLVVDFCLSRVPVGDRDGALGVRPAVGNDREITSAFAARPLSPALSPEYRGEGVISRPWLAPPETWRSPEVPAGTDDVPPGIGVPTLLEQFSAGPCPGPLPIELTPNTVPPLEFGPIQIDWDQLLEGHHA